MGPRDPFSTPTASPTRVAAERENARADASSTEPPVRIQARMPHPPMHSDPSRASLKAPLVGGAVGLVLALLFILLTPGQAILVIVFTALGAALGALVRSALSGVLDVSGAWRALRRR